MINPASKNRRNYWVDGDLKGDAEQWLASATEKPGSWWHDWAAWLEKQKGGEKAAPKVLGNEANPEIEPAPGRYVKAR